MQFAEILTDFSRLNSESCFNHCSFIRSERSKCTTNLSPSPLTKELCTYTYRLCLRLELTGDGFKGDNRRENVYIEISRDYLTV